MPNTLTIIIVNYRTTQLTLDCLHSIAADGWLTGTNGLYNRGQVIVVDNNSGDDSVQRITQAIADKGWQDWVTIIAANHNGGFAYGNNLGIQQVLKSSIKPSYILLLNPDTRVRPGAIETMVKFMDQHSLVGIAGGGLLDAAGVPQSSGFRFPSVLGELNSGARLGMLSKLLGRWAVPKPLLESPSHVDWVSGACFMIRTNVIEEIGLLDEKYFMYYEEVDYCRQLAKTNWEVWQVPEAQVEHLEAAASGLKEWRKAWPRYWYESRQRYFVKNHGRLFAMAAEAAFLLGYLTWRLRRPLQGKPDMDPSRRLRDGWRYIALPTIIGQ